MQDIWTGSVIKVVMKARIILLMVGAVLMSMAFSSCKKIEPDKNLLVIKYLYAGDQKDNGFQMWIWLFEDQTKPAAVRSGMCRYVDGQWIDTDEEYLKCNYTDNGFTLCDPETGEVRYTATYVQKESNPKFYYISVSWNHSPGPAWDANAEEKGWRREMELWIQVMDEG